jgi:Purple acid Phosphatase, N-terminal domain
MRSIGPQSYHILQTANREVPASKHQFFVGPTKMNTILLTVVMIAAAAPCSTMQATAQASYVVQDADNAVRITHGPVVENVTDTTAVIAWSTNVNAGTLLRYGTDPNHLDQTAGMPWGGLTHRVNLKDLKPDTKYYFQAESPKGQGSGTTVSAPQSSFRTKTAGTCTGPCA